MSKVTQLRPKGISRGRLVRSGRLNSLSWRVSPSGGDWGSWLSSCRVIKAAMTSPMPQEAADKGPNPADKYPNSTNKHPNPTDSSPSNSNKCAYKSKNWKDTSYPWRHNSSSNSNRIIDTSLNAGSYRGKYKSPREDWFRQRTLSSLLRRNVNS